MSSIEAGSHSFGWRKTRRSMGNGECVEVAPASGRILVRDSKNPSALLITYPTAAWQSFLTSAKRGDFDMLKLFI
jgi:hypothetical protein